MGQTNVNVPGDSSSGTGPGLVLLLVIVIGFLVWYFLLQGGSGGGSPTDSMLPSLPLQGAPGQSLPAPSAVRALLLG